MRADWRTESLAPRRELLSTVAWSLVGLAALVALVWVLQDALIYELEGGVR